MIFAYPILFFGYKLVRKTKVHKPEEVDLFKGLDEIEEYQRNYIPTPPRYAQRMIALL
jgi:amino acid transporter